MKVSDLKAILETLPPDLEILFNGYEGGFHILEVQNLQQVYALLNGGLGSPYYGPHEVYDTEQQALYEQKYKRDWLEVSTKLIPCLVIDRNRT